MKAIFSPSRASGTVAAPPSKSMSHRLLLAAGMAKGRSVIRGIASSEDVEATIDCLRALGVAVDFRSEERVAVVNGIDFRTATPKVPLFCRESGSTLRFFLPPALLSGKSVTLSGAASLLRRPMDVYENYCRENGISFIKNETSITVSGTPTAGKITLPGSISSQFISGFLFMLPLLPEESLLTILPPIESRSYIDLTISALKEFGIAVEWKDEKTLRIPGNQEYFPHECTVEGDYSNAAFLEAYNLFRGDVEVLGLSPESLQGDKIYKRYFKLVKLGAPALHIGDCPDLGPILIALAAALNGAVFSGTRRLRIKESDRADAMACELRKMGASVSVYDDSVAIYPLHLHSPKEPLSGHNDHRIVMALSVLLSLTGGEIEGAEAVTKSYPDFFADIKKLGIEVTLV